MGKECCLLAICRVQKKTLPLTRTGLMKGGMVSPSTFFNIVKGGVFL